MRCALYFEQEGLLETNELVHEYLEEVHLHGFYATPNQIKFAIYLLKHALALKLLVIDPKGKFRISSHPSWMSGEEFTDRQSWFKGEREEIYEKLQEFSKDDVLIIK